MKYKQFSILLGFVFFYFVAIHKIDNMPIQTWDESRLAANAIEMYNNQQYLVSYYDGQPDLWNTKPPLMIWLQVISLHIFGINELAIRFPSIVALILTSLILIGFSYRVLNHVWIGILAVFVLISMPGYNTEHGFRTGDYEALLILFTTLVVLIYFHIFQNNASKYWYGLALFLIFAVLTKSITALLFIPGLFLYLLYIKKWKIVFLNNHFYFSIGLFLLGVASYYISRELYSPGYLNAVWQNELGGRYLTVIEAHSHPFYFYISNFTRKFSVWIIVLALGFIFFGKKLFQKDWIVFFMIQIICFIVIISIAKTKLYWYDLPTYPFFALIIAYIVLLFFQKLNTVYNFYVAFIAVIILFLLASAPLIYKNLTYVYGEDMYILLKKNKLEFDNKKEIDVALNGYQPEFFFYFAKYKAEGKNLNWKDFKQLKPGDSVYIYQESVLLYLQEKFYIETTIFNGKAQKVHILADK